MDIVTHACIGLIAAAPVLNSNPELALGLVAGSVLPDLDALSRVFGKRVFLNSHQTWSHALPMHAAGGALAGFLAYACGADGFLLGAGLLVGLAFHTLLDFSNTLGVTLIAPFSRKRFCLEWVFFIDAFVLMFSVAATGLTLWLYNGKGEVPMRLAAFFFGTMAAYFSAKGLLRKRARALAPEAITLMPSALWPWRFFGVVESGNCVSLFQVNPITGNRKVLAHQKVFDADYAGPLATVPEYGLMRELSPAYHVVSVNKIDAGEIILCRDLRTRNFETTFSDLEVLLDANKMAVKTTFHV